MEQAGNKESGEEEMTQLTVMQLWALVSAGPLAMILTVLVGILINNAVTKAHISRLEGTINSKIDGLSSEVKRVEGILTSEFKRVERVLSAKVDGLSIRVRALEDAQHSPLVKG
jgi:hypothetical protein